MLLWSQNNEWFLVKFILKFGDWDKGSTRGVETTSAKVPKTQQESSAMKSWWKGNISTSWSRKKTLLRLFLYEHISRLPHHYAAVGKWARDIYERNENWHIKFPWNWTLEKFAAWYTLINGGKLFSFKQSTQRWCLACAFRSLHL